MSNDITVVAITIMVCGAMFFLGVESKEICIAGVTGLVGFLTGKATR